MSTSHTTLTSASDERKARLAKLASLKRKQPGAETTITQPDTTPSDPPTNTSTSAIPTHLSNRNYDPLTRAPRLGFSSSSTLLSQPTVESQSTTLLTSTLESATLAEANLRAAEAAGTGGVDLFKLQPKKPNWDLKRELKERERAYNVEGKTRNAIARMVRERIERKKQEAREKGHSRKDGEGEGEEVGIEGAELVEGVKLREKEEEEEERRERELEKELEGDGEGVS